MLVFVGLAVVVIFMVVLGKANEGSSMDPVSFAVFSFLNRIASRAPDFFKIPHDAVIEVGFRVMI